MTSPQWRQNKNETAKSLRYSPHQKNEFTENELRRMFAAREDNVADYAIAKRFGISPDKLVRLIGRRGGSR